MDEESPLPIEGAASKVDADHASVKRKEKERRPSPQSVKVLTPRLIEGERRAKTRRLVELVRSRMFHRF